MQRTEGKLVKSIGAWEVMAAGVALVVAATTLVSDFQGYFRLGWGFVVALLLAFLINLLLALSAVDLSVAHPRAGALYDYAREIFRGKLGRHLGVFLGLCFFGMSAFAISGEAAAGAYGLKALVGLDLDIRYFIVVIAGISVVPNIFGIRALAWASAVLLVFMLGIRWFFGISGFLGWGQVGAWSAANLMPAGGMPTLFGDGGIVMSGFTLAFWTFVGIEFACTLAEEVESPGRSMPVGVLLGLLVILGTSLLMGIGVVGTAPLADWQSMMKSSKLACGGDCVQLAVGKQIYGDVGYALMALASAAATIGSLTVVFAAIPRIIFSISRAGLFFGPLSQVFGRLHPRYHTPINAILLTVAICLVPAFWSAEVVEWAFSAAYVWILLYVVFHVLALANRYIHPRADKAFGPWLVLSALAGVALTLVSLYFAFHGAHAQFGMKALMVIGGAFLVALVSIVLGWNERDQRS